MRWEGFLLILLEFILQNSTTLQEFPKVLLYLRSVLKVNQELQSFALGSSKLTYRGHIFFFAQ